MKNIQGYESFTRIKPIHKGWSSDKKYYVETINGDRLLLRISKIEEYEKKKEIYTLMEKAKILDIPMSYTQDFGICDDGEHLYTLLTWCEGLDAKEVLPSLSEKEQYQLGVQSGEILKKIHSIPMDGIKREWSTFFNHKTDTKIEKYRACGIRFVGDDKMIEYIHNHRHLLVGRPQTYQHGDYHVGNMVISSELKLSIIDFNGVDYGDPWEEFNRIVWSAKLSKQFATGQLIGYFGGRPPLVFFELLAFYMVSNAMSSIYWAIPFGQAEVDNMLALSQDILSWFDNMENPVPTWFLE